MPWRDFFIAGTRGDLERFLSLIVWEQHMPTMFKNRLAVKDSEEDAWRAARLYDPPPQCCLKLSMTDEVLLEGFMDGWVTRVFRKGYPGLDIKLLPIPSFGMQFQMLQPAPSEDIHSMD